MLPDSELVHRVQQGDASAYEQLVRRYERAAMIIAVPIVKDYHSAEDVIQDSFIIATITGRPVGTVTKQLSRGIRRLRQWLQKQEFVS